jgi:hypothetical protein
MKLVRRLGGRGRGPAVPDEEMPLQTGD